MILTSKLKRYCQVPEADGCIDSFTGAMSLKLHFLMALTKLDPDAKALHDACHHAETILNSIRHGSRFINVLA